MKNIYLQRYAATDKLIKQAPADDLGLVITIPSYKEEFIIDALESIKRCQQPASSVEVMVLINYPENATDDIIIKSEAQYKKLAKQVKTWNKAGITFHILKMALPKKHAGVGLARKILMDEAVRRFETICHPKGIVAAFDADCTCQSNYLVELFNFFELHPKANGCSIYFEHHKEERYDDMVCQAVHEYELHLRCYIDALRWCGIPHAFQTIGSSMAVNHKVYQQQGGMNRKKAGEDFYFLHRIIPLGEFGDLTSTTIFPSIRPSDRVPFGTGKAVTKWLNDNKQLTYHPSSYPPLKKLTSLVSEFYKADKEKISNLLDQLSEPLKKFLVEQKFEEEIVRIQKQSTTQNQLIKHFYNWFSGFLVMKYLHYVRDNYYPMKPIAIAAREIQNLIKPVLYDEDLLRWFRAFDRKHAVYLRKR